MGCLPGLLSPLNIHNVKFTKCAGATSAGQEYKGIVQNIKKVGQGKLWVGKDYCNFVMKDLANLNAPYEGKVDVLSCCDLNVTVVVNN